MLTNEDIKVFKRGGFTDFEIGMINEDLRLRPQTIDPNSAAWQQVFKARLDYIRTCLSKRMSLGSIYAKIISYSKSKNREHTPWDFLREIYPVRGQKRSDFQKRIDARAKVEDHFGRAYR